ncbi:MAG: hypothetical protein GY830_05520 [Bacteroidetes bacterium]|nr:hypothetical protein [Bacteroidota bacterium]
MYLKPVIFIEKRPIIRYSSNGSGISSSIILKVMKYFLTIFLNISLIYCFNDKTKHAEDQEDQQLFEEDSSISQNNDTIEQNENEIIEQESPTNTNQKEIDELWKGKNKDKMPKKKFDFWQNLLNIMSSSDKENLKKILIKIPPIIKTNKKKYFLNKTFLYEIADINRINKRDFYMKTNPYSLKNVSSEGIEVDEKYLENIKDINSLLKHYKFKLFLTFDVETQLYRLFDSKNFGMTKTNTGIEYSEIIKYKQDKIRLSWEENIYPSLSQNLKLKLFDLIYDPIYNKGVYGMENEIVIYFYALYTKDTKIIDAIKKILKERLAYEEDLEFSKRYIDIILEYIRDNNIKVNKDIIKLLTKSSQKKLPRGV